MRSFGHNKSKKVIVLSRQNSRSPDIILGVPVSGEMVGDPSPVGISCGLGVKFRQWLGSQSCKGVKDPRRNEVKRWRVGWGVLEKSGVAHGNSSWVLAIEEPTREDVSCPTLWWRGGLWSPRGLEIDVGFFFLFVSVDPRGLETFACAKAVLGRGPHIISKY